MSSETIHSEVLTSPKPAQAPPDILRVPEGRHIVHAAMGVTAVTPKQFPESDRIEVAFVGRSNVGKSSMINTMLNRKSLVRTSQSPGKTRTINFFEVESGWYFVDLPGYGYARV